MDVTIENIMVIIFQNVVKFKNLAKEQFTSQWVYLGCDGDFLF
jgi:hypothetical protein